MNPSSPIRSAATAALFLLLGILATRAAGAASPSPACGRVAAFEPAAAIFVACGALPSSVIPIVAPFEDTGTDPLDAALAPSLARKSGSPRPIRRRPFDLARHAAASRRPLYILSCAYRI